MLTLYEITKTFHVGTPHETTALQGISLTMEQGEFATIIGSNGAGKSTLFNVISGAYHPEHGQVLMDGEMVTYQPEYRRSRYIGRLFQDPLQGTAPNMTIEENMALAYLRAGQGRGMFARVTSADRAYFLERLEALGLGLEHRLKDPVGLLSGGQRQALTLLMATLVTPKLLLLDEHTAALDPATADQVLKITREIVAEQNITCLMITHNIASALEVGDRTLMMDSGRIVLDVAGAKREALTVAQLLAQFKVRAGKELDDDRILLS